MKNKLSKEVSHVLLSSLIVSAIEALLLKRLTEDLHSEASQVPFNINI